MADYDPILLSCEMNAWGFWSCLWSVRPGLRMAVMAGTVGFSRSEAIEATRRTLPVTDRSQKGTSV